MTSDYNSFVIVTPSFNLAQFIEQTIYSVVGQAGDFSIRYHIQDGGSSDATIDILEKWKRLLSEGRFPKFCRDICFTYSVQPDAGMYDAIDRGFEIAAQDRRPCVMGWINADDLLFPGALAAVSSFLRQYQDAELVGGRGCAVVGSEGFLANLSAPKVRSRAEIAGGHCDGRRIEFIQQEGTFWRSALWDRTGGLNTSLKYAGDYDLWRRFAQSAEHHTLDVITGAFRRREGQLSGKMDSYCDEIEMLRAGSGGAEFPAPVDKVYFRHDDGAGLWTAAQIPAQKWRAISGVGLPEGPFPQFGIEAGRWIVDHEARIAVWCDFCGVGTFSIDFRNPFAEQTICVNGLETKRKPASITAKMKLNLPFRCDAGWNAIDIRTSVLTPENGGCRSLGIFIENARITKQE